MVHPIGINDPENIVVIGDEIDAAINYVFQFNPTWAGDAGALEITDFTPPLINTINCDNYDITVEITDCLAAYILYQSDGSEYIEEMTGEGDIYSGIVPSTTTEYRILAQDEYFNTVQTESQIIVDTTPPYTSGHNPAPGAVGIPVNTEIVVHVLDDGDGVDISTIEMTIDGVVVIPDITGTPADYTLTYNPPTSFDYLQVVDVTIDAADLASPVNAMIQDAYSFTTTMTTYDLTMVVDPSGGGTTIPAEGDPYSYGEGEVVDISAIAATGYEFDYWTGGVADPDSASTSVTMDGDKTVTAYFNELPPQVQTRVVTDVPNMVSPGYDITISASIYTLPGVTKEETAGLSVTFDYVVYKLESATNETGSATITTNASGDAVLVLSTPMETSVVLVDAVFFGEGDLLASSNMEIVSVLPILDARLTATSSGNDITFNLTDQYGNPLSGQTLTFVTGSGTLSAPSGVTDGSGDVTVTLSGATSAVVAASFGGYIDGGWAYQPTMTRITVKP